MSPIDQLIHARWVLPIAPNNIVLEHHSIAIDKGKIIAVLPTQLAEKQYEAKEVQHRPTHAIMPGLVNTHTHTPMNLFRGLADDLPLMDWLNNHIWPAEKATINKETVHLGARLAIAEMLRGGTTCFSDHYFFPDVIANTAIDAGIRATVGQVFMNVPTDWAADEAGYVARAKDITANTAAHPLITWSIAPHAPYTNSDSSLLAAKTLADELGLVMHMHLHETQAEIDIDLAAHQKRPIQRLADLGLIDDRFVAVHMTQLTTDEIALIADKGASVVHCPESNLKLASGFAPIASLLDAGVNIAIGTDGAASNNDLDMFGELQTAAMLGKAVANDPTALPAERVLEMATLGGARALHLDDTIGSLEAGKAADIIAVDFSGYQRYPIYNPLSHLVYVTARDQVSDVWVNGVCRVDNGVLQMKDIEGTMAAADTWIEKIGQLEPVA